MIVLDLQLGSVSGFDVIVAFRRIPHLKTIPIIIVSGKNQIDDVRKAISLGANDYIVKPIDPLILREKIQNLDTKNKSEFYTVPIGILKNTTAVISKKIQFIEMSEFGVSAILDFKITVDDHIEVKEVAEEYFGTTSLMLKCLSVEALKDSSKFQADFTFVGLKENQRQIIRNVCKKIWIQQKQAEEKRKEEENDF